MGQAVDAKGGATTLYSRRRARLHAVQCHTALDPGQSPGYEEGMPGAIPRSNPGVGRAPARRGASPRQRRSGALPRLHSGQSPGYGDPWLHPGQSPGYGDPWLDPGQRPGYGDPWLHPGQSPGYGDPWLHPGQSPGYEEGMPGAIPRSSPGYGEDRQAPATCAGRQPDVRDPTTSAKVLLRSPEQGAERRHLARIDPEDLGQRARGHRRDHRQPVQRRAAGEEVVHPALAEH